MTKASTVGAAITRILESSVPWKAGAVLAGASILGTVAFLLTSSTPTYSRLGPLCLTGIVREPGFDPWTGEPFGTIYRCTNDLPVGIPGTRDVTEDPPDDLASRRAIPIPAGAALGVLVLGGLAVFKRGRAARPVRDAR
jgi:hypothetical protein